MKSKYEPERETKKSEGKKRDFVFVSNKRL